MKTLRDHHFPVISLDAALKAGRGETCPSNPTVVTFDDGFFSNYSKGIDILREFEIPATIYVTTYYVGEEVARSSASSSGTSSGRPMRTTLDLDALGLGWDGSIDSRKTRSRQDRWMWKIIEHAESQLDEDQRGRLAQGDRGPAGFELR